MLLCCYYADITVCWGYMDVDKESGCDQIAHQGFRNEINIE